VSTLIVKSPDAVLACIGHAYLAFAFLAREFRLNSVTVCPFALVFSRPCPLCGATRAIGLLLHRELSLWEVPAPAAGWLLAIAGITVLSTARLLRSMNSTSP
jgi:Protein of unknown function (DUF2752)